MTTTDNLDATGNPESGRGLPGEHGRHGHKGRRPHRAKRLMLAASAAVILFVGVVAGGFGTVLFSGGDEAGLLLQPKAITSLEDSSSQVAIAGKVAEVFGNKLIIQDSSGRALVETGPRWSGGGIAEPGEAVTVQGRFEDGSLRAKLIVHADGSVEDLGPKKMPFGPLGHEIARLAGR